MDITYLAIWVCLPLIAAYIAHRKRRSWIGALLLTAIAPPAGLLATLLTGPKPGGGKGASLKARLVLGLLPFWVALTLMLAGGATTKSAEYWNVAPWLLMIAIPASIVTLLLVELVALVRRSRQAC